MMSVSRALVVLAATVVCSGYGSAQDSCLRNGGGSCCPNLTPLDRDIDEAVANQPIYIVFLPRNEDSYTIDNICYTFFPVPDDSDTFVTYASRVYVDGSNEVITFILSEPETGVRRFGRGLCQYSDPVFAQIECDTNVYLNHRCVLFGACPSEDVYISSSNVYGFSEARQPISRSCLNRAKAAIRNNGLPDDDFYILPMRLPSRCVFNQVCTVASSLQRFCQTVGVAFPAVDRCVNLYK